MNRNKYNLLLGLAILLLAAAACVRQSERGGDEPKPTSSVENKESPAPEKTENNQDKKEDRGDFTVEHFTVKNPRYDEIDRQIKEEKTLEKAADKLNRSLILPHDIALRTKDCGEVNAFYNSKDASVTVCYELMEHFYKNFRSVGDSEDKAYGKMFDAVRFVFLHEIGHALIDVYNLPITGNEEDSADRCSSFINITELGEDGVKAVLAAADSFAIESKQSKSGKPNMADEHLLQEQRYFNSLCMLYGSDSDKYAYLVDEDYLPKARAVRCPQEWERTAASWSDLLAKWRKK